MLFRSFLRPRLFRFGSLFRFRVRRHIVRFRFCGRLRRLIRRFVHRFIRNEFRIGHGRGCRRGHSVPEDLLGIADLRGPHGFLGHGLRHLRRGRLRSGFGFGLNLRHILCRFFRRQVLLRGFLFRLRLRRIVVQFPENIRARRHHRFVHVRRLRDMILGKLERCCGLFLADIFPDHAPAHQILGFLERIRFLVVDFLDIDRRQPLLLADALNQLQSPAEFAVGTDFVFEGRVRIPFLMADIPPVIDRVLQACRIQRQIQLQVVAADVDLCNRRSAVGKGIRVPADARFRPLVGEQCVFQLAVEMLDVRAGLDQSALEALAVVRNDIAPRFLVIADDAFVSAEPVGIVRIVHKVLLVLAVVFRRLIGSFVLVIRRRIDRRCTDRHASVRQVLRLCLCSRLALLLTDQRLHQRFQQLLGFGQPARCRSRRRCGSRCGCRRRGGLCFPDRFGHGFFHMDESAVMSRLGRAVLFCGRRRCATHCGHAAGRRVWFCVRLVRRRFLSRNVGLRLLCHCRFPALFLQETLRFPAACLLSRQHPRVLLRLGADPLVMLCGGKSVGFRPLRILALASCTFLRLLPGALLFLAVQNRGDEVKARNARSDQQNGQHGGAGNAKDHQNLQHAVGRNRPCHRSGNHRHPEGMKMILLLPVPFFRLYHPADQHTDADRLKRKNQRCRRNCEPDPILPVAKQTGEPHPNR